MIDTDKYEGNTLGPWKIEGAKAIIGAEDLRITVKGGTQRDKNLRLVADAPLLLAEVKRLREENKRHLSFWEYDWDAMAEIERQMGDEEE